jgi:hypothetical protein
MIFSVYPVPLSIQILIYIKLVQYVKEIRKRVTLGNTLARARRELKMVRRNYIYIGDDLIDFWYAICNISHHIVFHWPSVIVFSNCLNICGCIISTFNDGFISIYRSS